MIGKLFWAKMPFEEEALNEIDDSHTIRPYLLFASAGKGEYFAFPATSQIPYEYALESNYIILGKSQIKLEECFVIDKDNLYEYNNTDNDGKLIPIDGLSRRNYSELIKKLMLNINFDNNKYPIEITRKVSREYNNIPFDSKDILYNGTDYIVCVSEEDEGYKIHDISFYAKKGYVEFKINGNKCYVSSKSRYINSLYNEYDIAFVSRELPMILNNNFYFAKKIEYNDNINTIETLPIGSVIGHYDEDDNEYIYIKINEDENNIYFLVGRKGSFKRDYYECYIPREDKFEFHFYNIETPEKLEYSMKKVLEKDKRDIQ